MSSENTLATFATETREGRYRALDGVRGIGALLVVAVHGLLALPGSLWRPSPELTESARILQYVTLVGYTVGDVAVRIFFALSGFVLALMLLNPLEPSYRSFVVRRICRIYLPYIVVVSAAMFFMTVTRQGPIPELSWWLNGSWNKPLTTGVVIDHVLMLGRRGYNFVDNPTWTLVQEMRYSLIFPAMFWILKRTRWAIAIACSLTITIVARWALWHLGYSGVTNTVQFVFLFAAGTVLAIHRDHAVRWFRGLPPTAKMAIGVATVLLINAGLLGYLPNRALRGFGLIGPDLGAALLILVVIGSTRVSRILEKPTLQWLGRISYSLYLSHLVVLLTLVKTLHSFIPISTILVLSLVLSLAVADFLYRRIERPAVLLGRHLANRIDGEPSVRPGLEAVGARSHSLTRS